MASTTPTASDAGPSGSQNLNAYVQSTRNDPGPGSPHSSPTLVESEIGSTQSTSSAQTITPSHPDVFEDEDQPEIDEEGKTFDPEAAAISSRVYIYPLPYPIPSTLPLPYSPILPLNPFNLVSSRAEPTSTLVLTTPSGWFVDLRFLKPIPPNGTTVIPPGVTELPQDFDTSRLEWAFAGQAHSTVVEGVTYLDKPVRHSVWTHWVDSRFPAFTPADQIPKDEGRMMEVPNGDVIEIGVGLHPVTNHMTAYEELWRDVPILSTRASDIQAYIETTRSPIQLTNMSAPLPSFSGSPKGLKHSILVRLESQSMQEQGVIVRLGQYIQGFYKRGDENTVERWEYRVHVNTETGQTVQAWQKIAWCGRFMIPCAVLFDGERPTVHVGSRIRVGDSEWVMEETNWWVD